MTTQERKVMELALEALYPIAHNTTDDPRGQANKAITAIKKALAKPEQEPVGKAYLCDRCQTPFDGAYECPSCGHHTSTKEPVYTTPPHRKPLTPEQLNHMAELFVIPPHHVEMVVRTIEAVHGIKE